MLVESIAKLEDEELRRVARVDRNQAEIVNALRSVGCSVAITSGLGGGFPDLVVGFRNRNYLIEIKDGLAPLSKRALTPEEIDFEHRWRGQYGVAHDINGALRICGLI